MPARVPLKVPPKWHHCGQSGFTLLEAIVALVILSTALAALFGLINTDLNSLRRAEAVVTSQNVVKEAVERLKLMPLSDGATGEMEVGSEAIFWSAQLVEPVTKGSGIRGGLGAYDHSLYELRIGRRPLGQGGARWYARVARYERVRKLEVE